MDVVWTAALWYHFLCWLWSQEAVKRKQEIDFVVDSIFLLFIFF